MVYWHGYSSPLGDLIMTSDGEALLSLGFHEMPEKADSPAEGYAEKKGVPGVCAERRLSVFEETERWLERYFSGKDPGFTPPMRMRSTPFRELVWEILLTIPFGETTTYGQVAAEVARRMGVSKMSARAVGGAVHHNPIALIVPCHRVVGADGSLTGYGGGIGRKRWLLENERVKTRKIELRHNFLFDLDQTLLDFHASERKALEIVLQKNGLPFSEEIYQHFKAYNKSLWLELEKGTISRTELFTMRFQDVFRRCGEETETLDPLKVNDDFIRTMSVNGVLMDGAMDFVKKVKSEIQGARIYIASNGATVNAKGRIASTELDRYIDGLFVSEEMGVAKPDAAFFEICLKEIGAPRSSCVMIGDSLTSDMLGAKNASLTSIWFMPTGDREEAMKTYEIDFCASTFDELFVILKKWSMTREKSSERGIKT